MKWIIGTLTALSLIAFSACSKSEDKTENTPTTQEAPTEPTTTSEGPEIPDEELPVETDFEEAAEKEINTDNYQAELDKLEQEIAGGK